MSLRSCLSRELPTLPTRRLLIIFRQMNGKDVRILHLPITLISSCSIVAMLSSTSSTIKALMEADRRSFSFVGALDLPQPRWSWSTPHRPSLSRRLFRDWMSMFRVEIRAKWLGMLSLRSASDSTRTKRWSEERLSLYRSVTEEKMYISENGKNWIFTKKES